MIKLRCEQYKCQDNAVCRVFPPEHVGDDARLMCPRCLDQFLDRRDHTDPEGRDEPAALVWCFPTQACRFLGWPVELCQDMTYEQHAQLSPARRILVKRGIESYSDHARRLLAT